MNIYCKIKDILSGTGRLAVLISLISFCRELPRDKHKNRIL